MDKEHAPNPELVGLSLEELTRLCFGNMPFSSLEPQGNEPVKASRQLQMDWGSNRQHTEGFEGYSRREFLVVRDAAKAHKHGELFEFLPGKETFEYKYLFTITNPTSDPRVGPDYEEEKHLYITGDGSISGSLTEDEARQLAQKYLWPAYKDSELTK